MKKLSVIVLALVLVVSLASVSFAATESFSGEISVTLVGSPSSQGEFAKGSENAKVAFDFTKNYSDNLSAGLTFYEKLDTVTDGVVTLTHAFDPAGFIKFNYSPVVVTVKTGIDGKATKDILTYAIANGPGMEVDYTVMEGLTATLIGNTAGNGFGYLAKADYAGNGLAIGAGYQGDEVEKGMEAIGAYGSYTIAGITVGGEFNSRTNVVNFDGKDGVTNILGKVSAAFGPLTANVAYVNESGNVPAVGASSLGATLDDDNADQDWAAYEWMRFNGFNGSAIKVDASYKLTEALSLSGNVQMILNGQKYVKDDNGTPLVAADDFNKAVDYTAAEKLSYNATATYKLSDALSVAGTYKAFGEKNAINVTLTDTFATGLVGTLSLDSATADAKSDAVLSYTAKVVATL